MATTFDMTQKAPNETVEQYQSRPLFPKPTYSQVISRHASTVLVGEPKVTLTKKEQANFDAAFDQLAHDGTLPASKFSDLLAKLNIKLSKDQYIAHVDTNLEHLSISVDIPMTREQSHSLYCKVYAAPVQHGPRLRKAAGRDDGSIVRDLVARGCDINTADGNGCTPLHHACFYGRKGMVKLLAALAGKDGAAKLAVDAKDNRGWTALMCTASNGHVDTVKALLDAKASLTEENLEGRTALHIAAGKGMDKVVKMMLSGSGSSLVNKQSVRGWTPLFDACLHFHEDVIRMLLKARADAKLEDMLGFTCDHYCEPDQWDRVAGGVRK